MYLPLSNTTTEGLLANQNGSFSESQLLDLKKPKKQMKIALSLFVSILTFFAFCYITFIWHSTNL